MAARPDSLKVPVREIKQTKKKEDAAEHEIQSQSKFCHQKPDGVTIRDEPKKSADLASDDKQQPS